MAGVTISPGCMDIKIAESEAHKVIIQKTRDESANALAEIRKQISNISNQIAENSAAGYKAIKDELPKLMEEAARAEYRQNESKGIEECLDLRINAFKKARDLDLELEKCKKFEVEQSVQDRVRAEAEAAAKHVNKILSNSHRYLYCHPDPEVTSEVAAAVEIKAEPPAKKERLALCGKPILSDEFSCASLVAKDIGWCSSSNSAAYPAPGSSDYELLEGCKKDDASRACWGINNGATDYNGALAYACLHGNWRRAIHMMNLGANDLQLGLACGIHANHYDIIRLMLARGARVTPKMIAFAAKRSNVKHIIFPGCDLIKDQAALEKMLSQSGSISKDVLDYIKLCY